MHRQRHRRLRRPKGYFISLALVFVWLMAGLHVTLQHSISGDNPAAQKQCQLCRLNHLAAADLKPPTLKMPPPVSGPPVVMVVVSRIRDGLPDAWRARAPPLT